MQKGIVKSLVVMAAGMMCSNAMAIAPGFYMGLMMGPASNTGTEQSMQYRNYLVASNGLPTETNQQAAFSPANPKSTQFGSRLFFGYKFNQYAGFEGGFTYFSGISYQFTNPNLPPSQGGNPSGERVPAAGTTGRVRGIDFVGKLDYSYNNTIGVFAKGGVTALYTTTPGALNITNYTQVPNGKGGYKIINSGSNSYKTKLAPTFAIGASYDLNQSWQLDASYTKYMAGGSLNGMNFYALGLSYHFVDVYCGQFLCAD